MKTQINLVSAGAAALGLFVAHSAWSCDELHETGSQSIHMHPIATAVVAMPGDGGQEHTIKSSSIAVKVNDGNVEVWLDGNKVEQNRLKIEDGKIFLLDEKGNEIRKLPAMVNLGGGLGGIQGELDIDVALDNLHLPQDVQRWWADQPELRFTHEGGVMLGVFLEEPHPAVVHHLGLDANKCTMISAIYEGLPAHEAGLEQYDIIVGIDGAEAASKGEVHNVIRSKEAGDELRLTVIQAGKQKKLVIDMEDVDGERVGKARLIGQPQAMNIRGPMGQLHLLPEQMRDLGRIWVDLQGKDGNQEFFVQPDVDWRLLMPDAVQKQQHDRHLEQRIEELQRKLDELLQEVRDDEKTE